MQRRWAVIAAVGLLLGGAVVVAAWPRTPRLTPKLTEAPRVARATKLYWFIPDGLRAEPDQFTVFRWAQEGRLPNIKRMMDAGAFGYSIPDFPSHTPTNFASLLTGAHPHVHGVADGPMHAEGSPLAKPSVMGFSSVAKKVPPIWKTLEESGKQVALLSIPGSTPPELQRGITVRGRWGGWGADTPAVIFEPTEHLAARSDAGRAFRLFFLGQRLTEFVPAPRATAWSFVKPSYSPPREVKLEAYGRPLWALVEDSSDDGVTNYDTVSFSLDRASELVTLRQGAWSEWRDVTLEWKGETFPSQLKIKVIKLWPADGAFRIRLLYNATNRFNTVPAEVSAELTSNVGPMVDFVDNWPQQLVYEDEDKDTFLEEARMTLDWHRRAAAFMLQRYRPDVLIQDTYTPNQMLEARWWMRDLDRGRSDYDPKKADVAMRDVLEMYRGIDAILGAAIDNADEHTIIVLSSDHGVCPLRQEVLLNNLFHSKGWLEYTTDPASGELAIDWVNSKVVYLKMAHIYVNPAGLGGAWRRGSGEAYEALRRQVIEAVTLLRDGGGKPPLSRAVPWEEATRELGLPTDRVGDVVVEVVPGYQTWEEVTSDGALFKVPRTSGYKQGMNPATTKELWTPFVIMGPGVKKGFALPQPISHVDQMPTMLRLLGVPVPAHVQGRVLEELLTP